MHTRKNTYTDYDYLIWGIVCLMIAVVGFWPSYVVPLTLGRYQPPSPAMPWHVLSTVVWLLLLIVQPLLIQQRSVAAHRWIGMIGVLVAINVLVSGAIVQFDVMPAYANANDFNNAVAIPFIRMTLLLGFGICISFGIILRRRTDWHKRLILLGTFPLLQSPFDRMGKHLFAIPEVSGLVAIGGHFLLMILFVIWDRWITGYFHPVTKWGVAMLFVFYFLSPILAANEWWRQIAEQLSR